MPNIEIKPEKFVISHVPKFDRQLSRGAINRQIIKICYSCNRAFNKKKKGRNKFKPVINAPGRFVCQKCAEKLQNGQVVDGIKYL